MSFAGALVRTPGLRKCMFNGAQAARPKSQACEQFRMTREPEIPDTARIAAKHRRQQRISQDADRARQAVAQVRVERYALLSEIRTIHFIIYGCTGLFQPPRAVKGRVRLGFE